MGPAIESEWATAELGDQRRTARVQAIGRRWAAKPSASFPEMLGEELAAAYDLFNNEHVDAHDVVAAHVRATVERVDATELGREVLVIQDTTTCEFGGEGHRADVGWVSREKQGFFAHLSLLLSADGSRRPLGVIGLSTFMRERPLPLKERGKRQHDGKKTCHDDERESLRWSASAEEAASLLRGHAIPIHVTDRESDSYEYLSHRVMRDQRFVARARELNRPVTIGDDGPEERTKLRVAAERAVPVAARTVKLHPRPRSPLPGRRKSHPPRTERSASLEIAAERVHIMRPKHLPDTMLPGIDIHVVHVREPCPPADVEPVEWILLTNLPVDTPDEILRIVDHYRARWTVEELFKAIKTGCAYESRQLESFDALLVALAVCIPVAWQMLVLRHQSRAAPDAAASTVISERMLAALRTIAVKPLPETPSVLDVLLAIARLGGHLERNGPPGWKTLRQGMNHLLIVEAAFAARDAELQPLQPERTRSPR